jgi:hypothetical protein
VKQSNGEGGEAGRRGDIKRRRIEVGRVDIRWEI